MDTAYSVKIPSPILDAKEEASLDKLTERYEKLIEPNIISKAGKKVVSVIPESVKKVGADAKNELAKQELYKQCLDVVARGFHAVESQAAKISVSEKYIIDKVNLLSDDYSFTKIEEFCLARSYELSKLVNHYKTQDVAFAFTEGAATGAVGFAGLPFNLVL